MSDVDKILVSLIALAIVAVIFASHKSTGAITAIGTGVAALAGNIVGVVAA